MQRQTQRQRQAPLSRIDAITGLEDLEHLREDPQMAMIAAKDRMARDIVHATYMALGFPGEEEMQLDFSAFPAEPA